MRHRILLTVLTALVAVIPQRANAQDGMIVAVGSREVYPTVIHRLVYSIMESCTGRKGNFFDVHWFVADAIVQTPILTGQRYGGLWTKQHGFREITLTNATFWNLSTISHEILHDLFSGTVPLDVADRCLLNSLRLSPVPDSLSVRPTS